MKQYNVVWNRPSKNPSGSMPIGNGDIGLNVWVEENGDLFFYISKTDAWSENVRLLKLGRVRVKFSPNPFLKGMTFLQTLKLKEGEIEICAGKGYSEIVLKVWVDANQPVIRVEAEGKQRFDIQVCLEVWRNRERRLTEGEVDSAYGLHDGPHSVIVSKDIILPAKDNRIVWFHRNLTSVWLETMKLQGMKNWIKKSQDPLLNLTFGGIVEGDDLVTENASILKSAKPKKQYIISIYPFTKQTATGEEWVKQLDKNIACFKRKDLKKTRIAHQKWWNDFWNRSWIRVSGSHETEVMTRGYTLQRFISACSGRGAFPIKCNGSIFTVDAQEAGKNYDADYRKWGGPYWFQNTRLAYWPMLASGDFDMIQPFFQMYINALPLAKERTRLYFGHKGAFFPETIYFWGAYANTNYGWDREGKHISYVDNNYIRYYYSGALELISIMLDYYAYTEDIEFLKSTLLPFAEEIIRFYDLHYKRDSEGKIQFSPAQSLEMWWDVVNPLPEIAGLNFVLDKVLTLPSSMVDENLRSVWQRLYGELPPIPTKTEDGKTVLLPAEKSTGGAHNFENPEFYAVFPYRLYGVGKPDLETGRLSFEKRLIKEPHGWTQDAIQAGYLGLTDCARDLTIKIFSTYHSRSRFPAFWGPNHDWVPDQDHGNVAVKALQTMLMHTEGKKIILFPAWPRDWDVEFKLHAPMKTTVEGVYRAGRVESIKITPKIRMKDVVVMDQIRGPRARERKG